MYVISHQGGGFKGAFGVPILRHLMTQREPDLVLGVSVGAINGVVACQGEFELLEDLWLDIDDKNAINGVRGFLKPSFLKGRALFSLEPLREKMKENLSLDKLKVPFGCGVVARETSEYHTFMSRTMKQDVRLINAVEASSAISGLMEPVVMKLRGKNYTFCDGGHLHSVPLLPLWVQRKVKEIDVILTNPIEHVDQMSEDVDGIMESIEWLLHIQNTGIQSADLGRYRTIAKNQGALLRVFAPKEDLGSMLKTDRETIQRRWDLGIEAVKNPVIYDYR